MNADMINGLFEVIGGFVIWGNVWRLSIDKQVRGVLTWYTFFFLAWGYWNLYYYPSLEQWWSFWGGVNIVLANSVWFLQMLYYGRGERRIRRPQWVQMTSK